MNDKSPRQQMSSKSTRSLKQKRADKKATKADAPDQVPVDRRRPRT